MRSKSFWLSVLAALALAAPMAASRTQRDEAGAQQQMAPDSPLGDPGYDLATTDAAQAPATTVASSPAQTAPAPADGAATQTTSGVETAASTQAAPSAQTAPDSATTTKSDEAAQAGSPMQPSSELPHTASPLALLALLGMGSAGSAAGVRVLRRR